MKVYSSNTAVRCADGLVRPQWATVDDAVRTYYDTEWGMPVVSERGVFECLSLEVFQAGLSWMTILKKRDALRDAFADFDPDSVASYGEADIERLLSDSRIIRNRAKITATIRNARATVALRSGKGLSAMVWDAIPQMTPMPRVPEDIPVQSDESRELARQLRSAGFSFIGPITAYSLMAAIGIVDLHLMDSHRRGCSELWPK